MSNDYGVAQPPMMSIYEYFHYMVTIGEIKKEKAFKICIKTYKEQFGVEPVEFIKYYEERYGKI